MSNSAKFTIEVEVQERFHVVPITPMGRQVTIPQRVNELLVAMPSHEAAVKAGTMLLALTDCTGFRIEKTYTRSDTPMVDGEPIMGELVGEFDDDPFVQNGLRR